MKSLYCFLRKPFLAKVAHCEYEQYQEYSGIETPDYILIKHMFIF